MRRKNLKPIMNINRRNFLKTSALASAAAFLGGAPDLSAKTSAQTAPAAASDSGLIVPAGAGLKITGTFLDEISHDIPHQNWGPKEWERDFQHMKAMGIDTVIMIRSGYRKFITYPSKYCLAKAATCLRATCSTCS